ncbi:PhoPQ-activated pathogenicity protein [Parapedobacter pyrenivorans]|uniref:PhoPQ-activated pathogenicity protein n=1 Tax=Parapedobacter pyrenivorans TaxID=1305674 RepID=A0A917HPY7_9SPHI|nr:PhoPQ-activated protein PqaA family protein [Parapedobacter pyrenivorans]GGG85767.1 PhoPQ-activated pathogenicity protein [Parapedobacter pyrenivorans]
MKKVLLSFLWVGSLCLSVGYGQTATDEVTPEDALYHYLGMNDGSYAWELKDVIKEGPITAYDIALTSQTWHGHVWKHQLTVIVPKKVKRSTALLFIDGGSVDSLGEPNWRDPRKNGVVRAVGRIAMENKAITAVLKQVPMQPLYGGRREDALISMTLHNYQQDNDYTWPLLFPMTKSALRAMDAIQEFTARELHQKVADFVVAGASKRGWTTWLTGASGDKRVKAIAPIVIDVVNMPANLSYQIAAYEEYSEEIKDYTDLGIPQGMGTESGRNIVTMVDPYSYRSKLTMPKMIFNGTNDPYWVVDAIKHYLDSIPGQNLLHYVPNAGHDLGDGKQAFRALGAFFGFTARGEPYPLTKWKTSIRDGKVFVDIEATPKHLEGVRLWSAHSEDRDFRDESWSSSDLRADGRTSSISTSVSLPNQGYKAFYLDLIYKDLKGNDYSQSTRVFVLDRNAIL